MVASRSGASFRRLSHPRQRGAEAEWGDPHAATIEQQYEVGLGVRGDMRLDTLRRLTGEVSIEGAIERLGR